MATTASSLHLEPMSPQQQEENAMESPTTVNAVGEGQEALWIEEEHLVLSPASTASSPASASRGFFGKKQQQQTQQPPQKAAAAAGSNSKRKKMMFRRKKVVQGHSVLLESGKSNNAADQSLMDHPDLTLVSTESSDDPQLRVLAGKISAARTMFHQALFRDADEALAHTAFAEAVSARVLADGNSATGSSLRSLQEKGEKLAVVAIKGAKKNNATVREAEARKAKAILEQILPPIDEVGVATKLDDGGDDDDNTPPPTPGVAQNLSMTSLNEILDAPEEKSQSATKTATKAAATAAPVLSATKEQKKTTPKKKFRLFGKKSSKAAAAVATAGAVAATTTNTKSEKSAPSPPRNKLIQRFEAKVVNKEEKNKKDDAEPDANVLEEAERLRKLDMVTDEALREALLNDDTESLSSYDGVKLFGGAANAKKKEKKPKRTEEIVQMIPKSAPRDLANAQPTFISVPQGKADILTQKSWESLMEQDAVDPLDAPNVSADANGHFDEDSTSGSSDDSEDDKYQVAESHPPDTPKVAASGVEDKYAVDRVAEEEAGCTNVCHAAAAAMGAAVACKPEKVERETSRSSRHMRPALADDLTSVVSEQQQSVVKQQQAKSTAPKRKLFKGLFKRNGTAATASNKNKGKSYSTTKGRAVPFVMEIPPNLNPGGKQKAVDEEEVHAPPSEDVEPIKQQQQEPPSEAEDPPANDHESEEDEDEVPALPTTPPRLGMPIDFTREQTIERTAIETSWKELTPEKKNKSPPGSPASKDPLIARLRGKKETRRTRRSVDP